MRPLVDPGLRWDENGTPHSHQFSDIYFHPKHGAEESEFVFLQGADLPSRWQQRDCYVIAETGFGTGLNFLTTWASWRTSRRANQRLHYVAVEAFPLSPDQIERSASAWPTLRPLASQLTRRYPQRSPGYHRIHLDDGITLTLLFAEVAEALQQLEASVDSWYLDGFAPAKNKAMWRDEVLREIGRLSAPGATLATFTAAGFVRRGLESAGFDIHKAPGFSAKRERLLGKFRGQNVSHLPLWAQSTTLSGLSQIAIVGAGVAGLWLQRALARRGVDALIIGADRGASGNPAANVMPRLSADISKPSRIFWSGYRYALSQWPKLGVHSGQGCLQLSADRQEHQRLRAAFQSWQLPEQSLQWLDASQASSVAGVELSSGGLWFPEALLIDGQLVGKQLPVQYCEPVHKIEPVATGWDLSTAQQRHHAEAVVVAAGAGAAMLPPLRQLPLSSYRGQLTALAANAASQHLRCTLVNSQYLTPPTHGVHLLGSTFDRIDPGAPLGSVSDADHQRNLTGLAPNFPSLAALADQHASGGWRGIRLTTPDRLPLVGGLPDFPAFTEHFAHLRGHERPPSKLAPLAEQPIFVLTALGARGFTSAPLLAELLVSQMLGEPWPIERELALLLHPSRFWTRDLKRRVI